MAKIETIRLRVNAEEKRKIEALAIERGYRNVSDFIRHTIMDSKQDSIDPKEIEYIVLRLNKMLERL